MAFDKTKFDKKTLFTLIAFILVGILLFFTIFAHNGNVKKQAQDPTKPNISKNAPVSEGTYYGKEAIELAGDVYGADGNLLDMSVLKKKTDFFDKNGKLLNLPTISSEEYAMLEKGMSYEQLCEIIGGKGEIISEIDKPGDEFYTAAYFFYGDKAETSATFVFQSNRLKSKANTDLEDKK